MICTQSSSVPQSSSSSSFARRIRRAFAKLFSRSSRSSKSSKIPTSFCGSFENLASLINDSLDCTKVTFQGPIDIQTQSDRFNLIKGPQPVKNGRVNALKKRYEAFAAGLTHPSHPKCDYYWAEDNEILYHIQVVFEEPDYHPLCFLRMLFYY